MLKALIGCKNPFTNRRQRMHRPASFVQLDEVSVTGGPSFLGEQNQKLSPAPQAEKKYRQLKHNTYSATQYSIDNIVWNIALDNVV